MGISLNGLTPAGTYPGLIKTGDNTAIDGTLKVLSDGNGNNLPMEVSTTGVNLTGSPTVNSVAIANTTQVAAKQDTLVSGTNIKTINGTSVLGSGNIVTPSTPPSGVAGAIQFSAGSAFNSDAANFFWDNTNKRLGVGTNAPPEKLQVVGSDNENMLNLTAVGGKFIVKPFLNSTYGTFLDARNNTDNSAIPITIGGSSIFLLATNNIGIGTDAPTARANIKGSGSTSATTSLLVQNSSGATSLKVLDDGSVFNNGPNGIFTNLAYGQRALNNSSGSNNIAIGYQSRQTPSSGGQNISIGTNSMIANGNGSENVGIGHSALSNNDTGNGNTAIGSSVSSNNFSNSVILGREATANGNNQFVVGSSTYNAGAIDSSAFTQDKRWKVKINGVDYYIALQTA